MVLVSMYTFVFGYMPDVCDFKNGARFRMAFILARRWMKVCYVDVRKLADCLHLAIDEILQFTAMPKHIYLPCKYNRNIVSVWHIIDGHPLNCFDVFSSYCVGV